MKTTDRLALAEAAAIAPGRPSAITVWRWCRLGLLAGNERIRLRHVRVGRKLYTSRADLEAFYRAVAAADLAARDAAAPKRTAPVTSAARRASREAAKRLLDAAGVGSTRREGR